MRPSAIFLAASTTGLAIIACSGAPESDLFQAPTTSTAPTEPDAPGASSSGPSSGASSSGSSSGASSSGSSSGASSSGSSSGASSSGAGDGGAADSGSTDASSGWKSPGILCGQGSNDADVYCSATTQVCCARPQGSPKYQCAGSSPTACGTGITIRCDDRTDCAANQVCCGIYQQDIGYRLIECQAQCTTPIPNTQAVRFCDRNAPVDECASIGKKCTASGALQGYSVCK